MKNTTTRRAALPTAHAVAADPRDAEIRCRIEAVLTRKPTNDEQRKDADEDRDLLLIILKSIQKSYVRSPATNR